MPRSSLTSFTRTERHAEIIDRRLRGQRPSEIARELGISRQRVHQVLNIVLDNAEREIQEGAARLRGVEAARLEAMGQSLWDRWHDGGDLKAAELWHRNRAQYCKLLGLDLEVRAPEQHLHIHEPVVQAFDRDIARLLRERARAAGELEAGVVDGETEGTDG